jgi:hypothetical protein
MQEIRALFPCPAEAVTVLDSAKRDDRHAKDFLSFKNNYDLILRETI